MPFTGTMTIAGGYAPSGIFCSIGLDGEHYIVQQAPGGADFKIAHIEGLTSLAYAPATWATDFAATVLPSSGGVTGPFTASCCFPAYGTARFWIIGYSYFYTNSVGRDLVGGVLYEIADPSTINIVGGGLWSCRAGLDSNVPNVIDVQVGTGLVVGSDLYGVTWMGEDIFVNQDFKEFLVKLPLSDGVTIDTSAGAWQNQISALPMWRFWYTTNLGRIYTNMATLVDEGGTIGVYTYFSQTDLNALGNPYAQPTLVHTSINPTTHANTGINDVSATFGIPFSDSGKNYAGVPTGDTRDDYTSPSNTDGELIFGRSFSDQNKIVRMRRFLPSGAALATSDFAGTPDVFGGTMDQVHLYKNGVVINSAMTDDGTWRFGGTSALGPGPSTRRPWLAELGPVRVYT